MTLKNKFIIIIFAGILLTCCFLSLTKPDTDISKSERRKLAQKPEFSLKSLFNGSYTSKLENYSVDQFVFRDQFRSVKAVAGKYIFQTLDNQGIYISKGHACKMEYPLNESSVLSFSDKLNKLQKTYFQNTNVYYTIIPDKNYLLAPITNHLYLDYERIESLLAENITDMTYIPLMETLTLDMYYKTDSHWKQETLESVADTLAKGLGLTENPFPKEYEIARISPFYGVYYGQAALPLSPDTISYLKTPVTENALVYNIEKNPEIAVDVYDLSKAKSNDPYEIFLSGAAAFVSVENPLNTGGRELIIFRDSYASSLIPMMLDAYSKITLIDTRYMNPSLIPQFLSIDNQDVLFIYSTTIVNQSSILRDDLP